MLSSQDSFLLDRLIANRDYSAVLAVVTRSLSTSPASLRDSALWRKLVNSFEWFDTIDEHEIYFNYSTALLSSVAETVERLSDKALATSLASTVINSVQFRQAAHSNGDPRALMRARARLFRTVLSEFPILREHTFQTPVSGSSVRIGVLFKHLLQDPETASVLPFFEQARTYGIEVILFVGSNSVDRELLRYVQPRCKKVLRLSDNLAKAVTQVRAEDLDILLFGNDVTAKPSFFAYLSFFRMARIQACCVSSLMTTASPAMDVYFGCPYYSESGFDNHFDERVVPVPNPGFAFSYPIVASEQADQFCDQLAERKSDSTLFVSGANQTKLHRGVISIWAEILRRCPEAKLLLYPFPPHFGGTRGDVSIRVHQQFIDFGVSGDRVTILPSIPSRTGVIKLLRSADVGLDSFPYTGVTTIVDAIEAGLPTVTLKGNSLRSSQGAAIMYTVGLTQLIVESTESYIELAVRLARDVQFRTSVKPRMIGGGDPSLPGFLQPDRFAASVANTLIDLRNELMDAASRKI